MPDIEYAVEVRQVSKRFKRRTIRGGHTTLKSQLVGLLTGKRRERFVQQDIEVLKNIDLLIPKGRTVGIIGQNGSGKSTLLKLLTGIYTPTQGTATIHGRVSALLELGAGFHPDFSGRENILINGVILGLSRAEIRARMDEIIAFSEIENFIDEPVRTYSSGMYMRLAFAVATFVDPDVLVIDEVLSVGDEHFTRKSRAKMEEFKRSGKTIVLVTHDLGTVEEWCDQAVWIDSGKVADYGEPRSVVARYRQRVAEREVASVQREVEATQTQGTVTSNGAPPPSDADNARSEMEERTRWGNHQVRIENVRLRSASAPEASVVDTEDALFIEFDFHANPNVTDAVFGIAIHRDDGLRMFGTNTLIEGVRVPSPLPARGMVSIRLDRVSLLEGTYQVDVAAHPEKGPDYDFRRRISTFAVRTSKHDVGVARPPNTWNVTGS